MLPEWNGILQGLLDIFLQNNLSSHITHCTHTVETIGKHIFFLFKTTLLSNHTVDISQSFFILWYIMNCSREKGSGLKNTSIFSVSFPCTSWFYRLGTRLYRNTVYRYAFYMAEREAEAGQCQEIFDHFLFCLKDSTWAPYEKAKTVSRNFSFSWRYLIAKFENQVSV